MVVFEVSSTSSTFDLRDHRDLRDLWRGLLRLLIARFWYQWTRSDERHLKISELKRERDIRRSKIPGNHSNRQQNRAFVILGNLTRPFSSQLESRYMRCVYGHRLCAASKRERERKRSKKREKLEVCLENPFFANFASFFDRVLLVASLRFVLERVL